MYCIHDSSSRLLESACLAGKKAKSNFYQRSRVVNGWHAILGGLLGNHCVNKVTSIIIPFFPQTRKCREGASVRDITSLLDLTREVLIRSGACSTQTEFNQQQHDNRVLIKGLRQPLTGNMRTGETGLFSVCSCRRTTNNGEKIIT